MIKLRCLAVSKWGHFFVGDICKVETMNHEDSAMTVRNADGQKRISKFRYTVDKEIKFEGNTFRLQCPLPE